MPIAVPTEATDVASARAELQAAQSPRVGYGAHLRCLREQLLQAQADISTPQAADHTRGVDEVNRTKLAEPRR